MVASRRNRWNEWEFALQSISVPMGSTLNFISLRRQCHYMLVWCWEGNRIGKQARGVTQKKMVLPVTNKVRRVGIWQEILEGKTGDFSSMIPNKIAQCCKKKNKCHI
jgi:hypothetical protein